MNAWKLCLLTVLLNTAPAAAATYNPLNALSVGVGLQERWLSGGGYEDSRDFEAVGNAALGVTHHLDVTAGLAYGFEESYVRGHVDVRLTASDAYNQNFSVWVGAGRYFSERPSDGLNEWAGKAGLGWVPLPQYGPFVLGVTAAQGFDSDRQSLSVSVTYPIRSARE